MIKKIRKKISRQILEKQKKFQERFERQKKIQEKLYAKVFSVSQIGRTESFLQKFEEKNFILKKVWQK